MPCLGDLCEGGQWRAATLRWFDGRALRAETKRCLDDFAAATRARPGEDANEASEYQLSDDELAVNGIIFNEVVKKRTGAGRLASDSPSRRPPEAGGDGGAGDGVATSTKEAFNLARDAWNAPARPLPDD